MNIGITDLASLLAFLIAGGLAYYIPGWLEHWDWFQALAATGKQFVAGVLCILPALAAVFVQSLLVQYPMVSAAVDPYIKVALISLNILIAQYKHGATKAALLRAQGHVFKSDK